MKFKKRPLIIDAIKWDPVNPKEAIAFMGEGALWGNSGKNVLEICTNEKNDSWVSTYPGDYIIRGIEGEIYHCKQSVFEKTYELAEVTTEFEPTVRERCNQCKGKGYIETAQGILGGIKSEPGVKR